MNQHTGSFHCHRLESRVAEENKEMNQPLAVTADSLDLKEEEMILEVF